MKNEQVIQNQVHNQGGVRRAKDAMEWIMKSLFMICGFIAIAFVLLITVYLIISGLPAIKEVGLIDFLFGTRWASTDKTDPAYGILPFILTSIYGTAGAIIIGVPIGFFTAVFLSKVAPPKVAAVIRPAEARFRASIIISSSISESFTVPGLPSFSKEQVDWTTKTSEPRTVS